VKRRRGGPVTGVVDLNRTMPAMVGRDELAKGSSHQRRLRQKGGEETIGAKWVHGPLKERKVVLYCEEGKSLKRREEGSV